MAFGRVSGTGLSVVHFADGFHAGRPSSRGARTERTQSTRFGGRRPWPGLAPCRLVGCTRPHPPRSWCRQAFPKARDSRQNTMFFFFSSNSDGVQRSYIPSVSFLNFRTPRVPSSISQVPPTRWNQEEGVPGELRATWAPTFRWPAPGAGGETLSCRASVRGGRVWGRPRIHQTGYCHPVTCLRSDEQIDPPEGERLPRKRQNRATTAQQQLEKRSEHGVRLTRDVTEATRVDGRNHDHVAGSDAAAEGRGPPAASWPGAGRCRDGRRRRFLAFIW